jgi:hypothetical protein
MSSVILNILSEFKGKKAFKEADTAIARLEKGAKSLGAVLGVSLGTAAIAAFGKSAVKAFTDDQKAAAQLSNTMKNLGLAFADADIQKFVEQLSLASGVADDQLRPAMQKLLQVTGSVVQSQKLLKNAIDISAGSGVDLATVASDLANTYVGNNRGLKKYALGLSAAELKTASFDKVLAAFNKNFSGASAAYLDTYAGKMAKLTTAAGEAKEAIGGALVDAFMNISGSTGIDDLISKMNTLTDSVVHFLDKFSEGLGILNAIRNSNMHNMSKNIQDVQVAAYNRRLKRDYMKPWAGVNIPKTDQQLAAEKKRLSLIAAQTKSQKTLTAEQRKQASLKKSGTVFDMDQIQRIAALKGKLSEEERTRVEAQLALLNDNDVLAKKLTDKILDAQDKTGALKEYFKSIGDTTIKNPFEAFDKYIADLQAKLDTIHLPKLTLDVTQTGGGSGGSGTYPFGGGNGSGGVGADGGSFYLGGEKITVPSTNVPSSMGSAPYWDPLWGKNPNASSAVTITVTGTDSLTQAIANSLQVQSLSGTPAAVSRVQGMFGA